jgi:DNA-binding PadR family transcriptional regulator
MFRQYGRAGGRPDFAPALDLIAERIRHHSRRGGDAGGEGWPFGRGWRRPGRGGERLFDRGDLKYVILDLLWERPRHGYDIIRALEERFGGLYSPSPGTVYPTLQLLEDQGYVSSAEQDGKKVFTVTEVGRAFLAEHMERVEGIRARTERGHGADTHAEIHALLGELRDLAGVVFRQASRGAFSDPERVKQLRGVVARARTEIEAILSGRGATEV